MFNKYYQDELTYLRDLGREFAHEYPALAPLLGQTGGDPDVERLLEGVAFLTGRVRQKLDDEVPEIVHSTASLLFPHLLRPVPAASILEILPNRQALRDRRIVAAGSEFATVPIDGTVCRFSSSTACEVLPWTLQAVRLQPGPDGRPCLSFSLTLSAGLTLGQLAPERVRLHVVEEPRIALLLTYFAVEHCRKITLTASGTGIKGEVSTTLPPRAMYHVGFDDSESLLPLTGHVMPGFRLVEEYFLFPAKFAFFEIRDLESIAQKAPKATTLEISIELDSQPPLSHSISDDCLRLHCVPVVNVFRTTTEPIRVAPDRERYLLRPAGLAPDRGSVYAVTDVVGLERGTDRRTTVQPFFDFTHVLDPDGSLSYMTHLQFGALGNEVEQAITIDRPGSDRSIGVDVLSIELLATNGRLGSQIRADDIRVPTPSSPAFAQFRNITSATPYVPVPLGNELHWRVTAHIATGLRTLADLGVLRAALRIYNLHGIVDRQAARAAELRIDAIRDVKVAPTERLYKGAVVRGISVQVELDESGFAGEGDMYLFGAMLDRLFASYVPINSFAATTVTGTSSRVRKAFTPRSGGVEII